MASKCVQDLRVVCRLVAIFVVATAISCDSSKLSLRGPSAVRSVGAIAISPGSAVGDAVGLELFNAGFSIVDSSEVSSVLSAGGFSVESLGDRRSMAAFYDRGIDALLVARETGGAPESVTVRVLGTKDGRLIAGLTWQNGSLNYARRGLTEAAEEIAEALRGRLRRGQVRRPKRSSKIASGPTAGTDAPQPDAQKLEPVAFWYCTLKADQAGSGCERTSADCERYRSGRKPPESWDECVPVSRAYCARVQQADGTGYDMCSAAQEHCHAMVAVAKSQPAVAAVSACSEVH